jgi:thiamine biosynthesis lipoprotein
MLHRMPFHAMGSEMLVLLELESETRPVEMEQVPAWFEDWEQILSRFRLDSELSRLNQTFDQPLQVSETLWSVFQAAQWAVNWTNGLVTPTILDAMIDAGYDQSFEILHRYQSTSMMPVSTEIHPLSMVIADQESRSICLPEGIRLDFGGIAKGWAAEKTVERLQKYGPVLMNAGGDIAISGPRMDGDFWAVGVSNPFETTGDFEVLYLNRGGVATSGKDRRQWNQNGMFRHHIINPDTGQPAESDLLRVTIVAPSVQEAEAAAKTVLILGLEKGLDWIEADSTLAGLLILDSGEVLGSHRMHEYFRR